MTLFDPCRQEIATDHRNKSHCHDEWHDHRGDIRHTDRSKYFSVYSWKKKKWYKYDELQNCRIYHTSSDFFRSFEYDFQRMDPLFPRKKCIQPQSPEYIFHIDDRIIYEFPDSDRETSENHDIDPDSKDIKYDSREKKRDRKWDHRDKSSTSIQKKKYDDDGYDERSLDEGFLYILKSLFDKPCLTENIITQFYTFRKSFLDFFDFSKKSICEIYCIGIRDFWYSDDHSLFPIDESISSSLTIFPDFYACYIFEDISIWEGDRADFFFGILYGIEFYRIFWFFIDRYTRSSWVRNISEWLREIFDRQMFLSQLRGIDRDRILRSRSSHNEKIRYSGYGREGLSELSFRIETEIWLTDIWVIRCESHPEYFPHQCWFWSHSEMYSLGKSDRSYLLIHSLAIDIDVTSPIEFDIHYRESSCRTRSHSIYWSNSTKRSFQWKCHDLLDILSTHAFGFSEYSDTRTTQIWEYIDRQFRETIHSESTDNEIEKENQWSSIEGKFYKAIEHDDYGLVDIILLTSIPSFHSLLRASVTIFISAPSHWVMMYFSQMVS